MRDFSTLYHRVKTGYGWQQVSLSPQDFMELYECIVALRSALIASGRSAGAFLADEVSNEFLSHVPEQVAGTLKALRGEVEQLKEDLKDAESKFSAMIRVEGVLRAQVRAVSDEENFHFEPELVMKELQGTQYLKGNVLRHLSTMTSGEQWSLYRAIAKLVIASRSSQQDTVGEQKS